VWSLDGYLSAMKNINAKKLKYLVDQAGGTAKVCAEADVGFSTLQMMMSGSYPSTPSARIRMKLSVFLKTPQAELFPKVHRQTAC
jgi:hypothetical protein